MSIFQQEMAELLTFNNFRFLLEGLKMTLFISSIAIVLSMIFGSILGIWRNQRKGPLRVIASVYVEVVRNIPNLLWIFVVFLVFQVRSVQAGIVSFTIFTSAAIAEIVRGGLNSVGQGQWEAASSQGFTSFQRLIYIILPQAIRSMLPAIVSQMVTVIKDSSFLWSVIAIQELMGKGMILMGKYKTFNQVLVIYLMITLMYFIVNFIISLCSRRLSKRWAKSR